VGSAPGRRTGIPESSPHLFRMSLTIQGEPQLPPLPDSESRTAEKHGDRFRSGQRLLQGLGPGQSCLLILIEKGRIPRASRKLGDLEPTSARRLL